MMRIQKILSPSISLMILFTFAATASEVVEPDQAAVESELYEPAVEMDYAESAPAAPAVVNPPPKTSSFSPSRNARRQPSGALSNIIVYTSGGHGWTSDGASWNTQRPLLYGMVEDMGNIDQLNLFAQYCFNAGATVVPFRPVGYQTNEVVIDNDDSEVTFSGTWYDSSSTVFYGTGGDTPYRYAFISTNGETASARYIPDIPADGYYPVYCWSRSGSDRVRQLYRIQHSGGQSEVRVNHERVGLGWVWLGSYYFEAGTNGYLDISNDALPGRDPANDVIIADAIRFGNGMGDIDRGHGLSGYERDLECSRYWIQRAVGQGMSSTIYDLSGYSDSSDNVGAPRRMTEEMNREADGGMFDRIYLGFHSNAGTGTGRGALALYDTRYSTAVQDRQKAYGQILADELNYDMEQADNGVEFNDDWTDNSIELYGSLYGEIYGAISNEMNTTIIEVAYHDNASDCNLLKDPVARSAIARACYQGIVKYLNSTNSSVVPLALLPEPPTAVRAFNTSTGVVVAWDAPMTNTFGGDAADGYVIYGSANGYGFDSGVVITGESTTSYTFTNLNADTTRYFQVAAWNEGGESFPAQTLGVRVLTTNTVDNLVVNGFERCDRSLSPLRYFGNNLSGNVTMVRPLQINAYDYVIQHGGAIAAAGEAFDSCANQAVSQADINLTNYNSVFWILGEESTTDDAYDTNEQAKVETFLDGGGSLFTSGAELFWDLDNSGSAGDKAFCSNYLHAVYAADDSGTNAVSARSGSIFNGMGTLTFDEGDGDTYAVEYPDVLSGVGSITSLVYGSSGAGSSVAAIQYSNNFRVVVMGFPFETIQEESARTDIIARVLSYFATEEEEPPPSGTLGEAVDYTNLTWTTSGDADWFYQTNTTYDSVDAAQSGAMGINYSTSRLETTVSGPGTLGFFWRVSSETNWDFLKFSIDGAVQDQKSGESGWLYNEYDISSGSHDLQWSYIKDIGLSNGSDCGWVDQVTWSPPETLWFQGFEGTTNDNWNILNGTNYISSDDGATDVDPAGQRIRNGSWSWQRQDDTSTATIGVEFAQASIAGYTNVKVYVHASAVDYNFPSSGMDDNDSIQVYVAADGTTYPSTADITVQGKDSGVRWGYTATGVATTTAGTARSYQPASNSPIVRTNDGYSTMIVSIPDGSTSVMVRVDTVKQFVNEYWNIDDVMVIGEAMPAGTSYTNIVVTEIMQNPNEVSDTYGEWFEIFNRGGTAVDIDGWIIKDAGTDSHTINNGGALMIAGCDFLVLGRNSDSATNGGVTVDYQYAGTTLVNTDDEIILLTASSVEVSRVEYDGGPNWPNPTGASMYLTDPDANENNYVNWATSTAAWPGGAGDDGTPGAMNEQGEWCGSVSDQDNDGIPDWWETLYFYAATGAVASADGDDDGANNWAEWIALTVPTNIASVFEIDAESEVAGSNYIVYWPSATGRTYTLYWNTDITSTFGVVEADIGASPPMNTYTDAVHGTEGLIYYKVKVAE